MQSIEAIETYEKESSYTYDEPHYPYNEEQVINGFIV